MLKSLLNQFAPYLPLVVRLLVGIIFLAHGLQKIAGIDGVIGYFTFLGLPAPTLLAWFIAILELVGGALLIVGLATRWLGALFVIEMLVATVIAKMANGVPLITDTQAAPTAGYELDLALLAASLVLFVLGSGALSVEQNVLKREL